MKKLLTSTLDKVVLHHKGVDYTFTRSNGAMDIPAEQIGDLPEAVALLLILLSGARRLYLPKETYFLVREPVWFHLDRSRGGLTEAALELFEDDEAVLETAKLHRTVFAKTTVKKTK